MDKFTFLWYDEGSDSAYHYNVEYESREDAEYFGNTIAGPLFCGVVQTEWADKPF